MTPPTHAFSRSRVTLPSRNTGLFLFSVTALFGFQAILGSYSSTMVLSCTALICIMLVHTLLRTGDEPPQISEYAALPATAVIAAASIYVLRLEQFTRTHLAGASFIVVFTTFTAFAAAHFPIRVLLRTTPQQRAVTAGVATALLVILLIIVKLGVFARLFTQQTTEHPAQWIGISYIIFRLISSLRDSAAGRLPKMSLSEFITYVVFAPALIAGPIERAERFVSDLRAPWTANVPDFVAGMQRIAVGSLKKFIIADTLAMMALHPLNAAHVHPGIMTWLLLYFYALQIFFDFSGYTDMAIGCARCLGIRLPENFANPYFAPNLTQFWNRWHISLTQWIRTYYFNPLARMLRKRELSPALIIATAQVSTMLLIGLWHGVSMNFAVWGLWHGIGLFLHNRWNEFARRRLAIPEERHGLQRTANIVGAFVTFHYVALSWVWFALPNPSMSLLVFCKLFGIT